MNMWQEQYCKNGVFGSSPREKELAVNAMLLRKENYFNTKHLQHKEVHKQRQVLKARPYPWKDEMCEVGLYCAGFDTLFGCCVFAASFSPIRMGKDIINHYGITDYIS